MNFKDEFGISGFWVGVIAVIVVGALVGFASFASVGVGEAALIVDPIAGGISPNAIVGAKWFFRSPLSSVVKIKYSVSTLGMWGGTGNMTDPTADYPNIQAFSAEGVDLDVDIALRYSLDVSKLEILYTNYPARNWEETIIASVTRETIRFVTKDYGWEEIRDERDVVAYEMEDRITEALNAEKSLGGAIINIEFDLRRVGLPQELINAVNGKVAAKEHMQTAEYQRLATLIDANATGQAQIIDAIADGKAREIRATGEAEAIKALMDTVGEDGWELFYRMQKLREIAESTDMLILTMDDGSQSVDIILPAGN